MSCSKTYNDCLPLFFGRNRVQNRLGCLLEGNVNRSGASLPEMKNCKPIATLSVFPYQICRWIPFVQNIYFLPVSNGRSKFHPEKIFRMNRHFLKTVTRSGASSKNYNYNLFQLVVINSSFISHNSSIISISTVTQYIE